MATHGPSIGHPTSQATRTWRDPTRYLWLLGAVIPALVFESWITLRASRSRAFWWLGPMVAFVAVPLFDYVVGADSDNPPSRVPQSLEDDRFYRWVTYLYIPGQYLCAWRLYDSHGCTSLRGVFATTC